MSSRRNHSPSDKMLLMAVAHCMKGADPPIDDAHLHAMGDQWLADNPDIRNLIVSLTDNSADAESLGNIIMDTLLEGFLVGVGAAYIATQENQKKRLPS